MRHNLVLAIMPPHIRGVPFIFYLTHGSAAIAATPMGYGMPPTFVGSRLRLRRDRLISARTSLAVVYITMTNALAGVEKNSRCEECAALIAKIALGRKTKNSRCS